VTRLLAESSSFCDAI